MYVDFDSKKAYYIIRHLIFAIKEGTYHNAERHLINLLTRQIIPLI